MDVTYSINEIISYANLLTAVYILAPIVTFLVGAVIGLMFYYKFGEKYGVKSPEFGTKIAKLHLPLYLAMVLYVLLIIFILWHAYYSDGIAFSALLEVSGYDCFYNCYLNPLFYFWAAAMIAAVVLTVLSFKKKVNFAVTYLIIGVSFIIFYWFTAYGARLYAIDYTAYSVSYAFTGINNSASPICIIAGIAYIVCAVLLALMTRKKKAVDEQPQE